MDPKNLSTLRAIMGLSLKEIILELMVFLVSLLSFWGPTLLKRPIEV